MAMASSSKTAVDEAPQECVWMELRLLQSIVVQSRLGQTVLKLMDNFLWVIEKCAEWSLPRQEVGGDENRKDSGKPELVRPLPWLLFLPTLVLLRVIRVTVNIGGYVLGYSKITPSGMVKFVQICRRYLNTGMNKGTKERHETKDKRPSPSINEAKKALIRSIRLTLSSLSCLDASKPSLSPPPTKIHVSSVLDPDPVTTTSEEKSVTESMDSTTKLKDSSSESEEEEKKETLNEKIDRLALENSEDDEDFAPTKSFSNDESSDEDDDENSDVNVSLTEIRDVVEDAISFDKNLKTNIEQFLSAEQTSASGPQETDEPDCGKRSSAKESRDKVEERLATSQRIDSPECYTPDRSSQEGDPTFYSPISSDSDAPESSVSSVSNAGQCTTRDSLKATNEFINDKAGFISASTISEPKSPGQTNNGAVVQKRSTNVSKCHKGKRTSHGNRKKK